MQRDSLHENQKQSRWPIDHGLIENIGSCPPPGKSCFILWSKSSPFLHMKVSSLVASAMPYAAHMTMIQPNIKHKQITPVILSGMRKSTLYLRSRDYGGAARRARAPLGPLRQARGLAALSGYMPRRPGDRRAPAGGRAAVAEW